MGDGEKPSIVMVAVEENLLNNLRGALAHDNLALLHAHSKQEAIALLERLKSEIKLAIVELELPNFAGWDLIRRFTFQKPLKIIATTSAYPESLFEKIKGIGVDAVVPKVIASEVWLKTVEKVLQINEGTTAERPVDHIS